MQTQRDHVHAQTFMVGRISSALVEGDPTAAQIPGQRLQTGLAVGTLLAVLLVAGFAVYGWIVPGGSTVYKQTGAILVEKETGNRYVYLDGALHPTPDLASALLIQNGGQIKLISRDSLKGVPRSYAVGVPGAPARVPEPEALVAGPWLACLPDSAVPGAKSSGVGLNLEPAVPAEHLPAGSFTVVRGRGRVHYLVTQYLKYKIADEAALVALGAAASGPPAAPAVWLGTLGDGPDLGPAVIPGAGKNGPEVGGERHQVGTLFRQGGQLFVLRTDGLAPMSRTEFLIADAADEAAPVELDPSALVGAERSADNSLLDRLPDLAALKPVTPGGRALCVRQKPVSADAFTSEVVFVERGLAAVDSNGRPFVLSRIGSGMVVKPAPSATEAPLYLVSDQGIAYRLADSEATGALKLDAAAPVPFPAGLLAGMEQGPVLSREAVVGLPKG
ncbi:type VII secretion protein EccB [Actinoplanes derwentensis]|uniref:Type VII secretion protein EccB n=1 Tax=Actinoplanes derwentensis TaxID=113562 RepID=A0A1H1XL54_9ACTN|nr:type VII secretion protein EccB [Actinoplanes derwentensis]GID87746.1 type VII secretion protein EccB [Actinoplanes derwentensis]SDT09987.1 type VII secretion protein EccB [Actinoplanes derwentensis]